MQAVILDTISGTRKWDPSKGELLPWLKSQVRSEIDALARSAAHRREYPLQPTPDESDASGDEPAIIPVEGDILGNRLPANPEQMVIKKEDASEAEARVNRLFEAIKGEPELEELLQAIIDGCEPKPRFLAAHLGVSIQEVNNRRKRLHRRAMGLERAEDEREEAT